MMDRIAEAVDAVVKASGRCAVCGCEDDDWHLQVPHMFEQVDGAALLVDELGDRGLVIMEANDADRPTRNGDADQAHAEAEDASSESQG